MVLEVFTNEKGNLEIENKENTQKLEVDFEEIMEKLDDYLDFYYCGIFDPNCKYVYQCLIAPRKQCDEDIMDFLKESGWEYLYGDRSDSQEVDIFCKSKSYLTEKEKESFENFGCSIFRYSYLNFAQIQEIKRKKEAE